MDGLLAKQHGRELPVLSSCYRISDIYVLGYSGSFMSLVAIAILNQLNDFTQPLDHMHTI